MSYPIIDNRGHIAIAALAGSHRTTASQTSMRRIQSTADFRTLAQLNANVAITVHALAGIMDRVPAALRKRIHFEGIERP